MRKKTEFVENTHEPIVSREIFAAVQEYRRQVAVESKNKPLKSYTKNVLQGKIFCGCCGKNLHRQNVKQAQVIQGFDNSVDVEQLTFQFAKQSGYEEQIADLQSNKMQLYEQYLSKEIDLERYKSLKSGVDAKLIETTQMSSSLKSQIGLLQFDNSEKKERLEIANKITSQSRLTEELAGLLIDKVMVYSQMQIEIVWKSKDFCGK